ncbi:Ribonuclease H domain - like 10 [Theobroma cacao]|nr:Ribonuclease H domain - like 10 [Theobroma cacao]
MVSTLSMLKGLAAASHNAVTIPCTHSSLNSYKKEMLVGSQNAPQGWVAVNSNGTLHHSSSLAVVDGVLRDYNEYWLGGFAAKLKRYSSYKVELLGVLHSLYIARDKGLRRIWLKVDNKIVVQAIIANVSHPCANFDLLEIIRSLL